MRRSDFLVALGFGMAAVLTGCGGGGKPRDTAELEQGLAATAVPRVIYVPGYDVARAFAQGVNIRDHPIIGRALPRGYDGPATLLTRIGADGGVTRALLPLRGHAVTVGTTDIGIFASMSGRAMVAFDAATLDLLAVSEPFADERVGGGHALLMPAGAAVLVAERSPYIPYQGRSEAHFGRISVREPSSLRVIETYSSHGIAPHEMALLDGGRLLAIAHYGSTPPAHGLAATSRSFMVEPCVTVLDLADGRLVDKLHGPDPKLEIRHLCAASDEDLFAIQVRVDDAGRGHDTLRAAQEAAVYELDRLALDNEAYLPAPMLHLARPTGAPARSTVIASADPLDMRQGLSILHDPQHAEVLATYPSAQAVIVVDVGRAAVKRVIRTDRLGLAYPCGLALLDESRYIVAGSFENILAFRRGRHEVDRTASHYLPLFRHSHIAVA